MWGERRGERGRRKEERRPSNSLANFFGDGGLGDLDEIFIN